jgi:hypothetical protein
MLLLPLLAEDTPSDLGFTNVGGAFQAALAVIVGVIAAKSAYNPRHAEAGQSADRAARPRRAWRRPHEELAP